MSAPSIEVSNASPASLQSIETLHPANAQAQMPQGTGPQEPGHAKMTLDAKGFLMKKMAAAGGSSFCSPTDTMVSPCTKKLAQSKQRHFAKGKPMSLSSTFKSTQTGQQASGLSRQYTGSENVAPF
ncbi:hypothetical protein OIO90_004867 [Microbotryomycetes sp. JL221]|nr:hypothetical protein OIO90_004867 [Microbotryomycetes sp. JL221]